MASKKEFRRVDGASNWVQKLSYFLGTVVGVILAGTGLLHLENHYHFLKSVTAYRILPPSVSIVVAATLPILSVSTGISLVVGWFRRQALLIASSLFLMFSIAQIYAVANKLDISCGCFGAYSSRISTATAILPLSMLALTVVAWFFAEDEQ